MKRWILIAIAAAAVAVVAGPYLYIHFIQGEAPPPLALTSTTPSATATGADTDGTWNVSDGSVVGYRVQEVLFGQDADAVGRTSAITGSMTVDGTSITDATFTVDMTSVTSDESRRDDQFNGRIMETSTFPTSTFTLTEPIELGSIPSVGTQQTFRATGDLTLHGVTNAVLFHVAGQYDGTTVKIAGSIPITFADYGIANPSFGPVTTEDNGELEFALSFTQA
jgi:polyisoprenoid-binding protein YceI